MVGYVSGESVAKGLRCVKQFGRYDGDLRCSAPWSDRGGSGNGGGDAIVARPPPQMATTLVTGARRLFRPGRPLRVHLTLLVLAAVIPMLVFAIALAALVESYRRSTLERSFLDTARALSLAVDHELSSSIAALTTLGTSEHLDRGDLEAFYEQAHRARRAHAAWITVNLTDASGRQLINLSRPFGAPLPSLGDYPMIQQAVATRRPAVSDLFVGRVLGRPVVGISVPIQRDGAVRYVAGARLDVASLTTLLSRGKLPPDWVASLVDRNGIILARTRNVGELLGRPATGTFAALARGTRAEGAFEDVTLDHVAVYAAYSRSSLSGWTVGLGIPRETVAGPLSAWLWLLVGGLVLLLVGTGLAFRFGRRVASELTSLAASARALGRGEAPTARLSASVAEVANVEAALIEAGRERALAVAARAQVETALRESEERTRLIVDQALDGVITIDAEGFITSWNPQAESLFGWTRTEVLGRRLADVIVPPQYRAAHEAGLARLRAGETSTLLNRRIELTALRRDGTEFPVELAITPLRVGGATVFSAFLRDITERKRAEEALATYAERLKILHDIDAAIIAADEPAAIARAALQPLRDLLRVPRAIVNLFDLDRGEVEWLAAAGRRRLRVGPGVRFPLAFMGDLEGLRRGEVQVLDTHALPPGPEVDALLASGVHVYRVVPMIADGELIGALSFGGVAGDLTEAQLNIAREVAGQLAIALAQARLRAWVKRQAEELEQRVEDRTLALRAANARLETEIVERRRAEAHAAQASQAKSDFLSRMSHELRTPLNAIIGFSEMVHDGRAGAVSPVQKEYLGDVLVSARHLLGLIGDLLDLAKIEAGRIGFRPQAVDVRALLAEVRDVTRPLATPRGLTIDLELDPTVGTVILDPGRLKQVVLNYLSNALKASTDGGRVTLRTAAEDAEAWRVEVEDRGIGIAADQLDRLFRDFEQLDGGRRHPGTGLGLALTRRIVEAQGGRVGVRSILGSGSTFFAVLPRHFTV
jgi:PAS domain S-box-containing protein